MNKEEYYKELEDIAFELKMDADDLLGEVSVLEYITVLSEEDLGDKLNVVVKAYHAVQDALDEVRF